MLRRVVRPKVQSLMDRLTLDEMVIIQHEQDGLVPVRQIIDK